MAAAITPGNVVVLRVGDGSATLSTAAFPSFLDEYTPGSPTTSGTLVQTIGLTTATANLFTNVGTFAASNLEGLISLSADRQYVVVGGYQCAVGQTTPYTSAADAIARVMAKVKISDGSVDTSIKITTSGVTGNIRGIASTDGSDMYAAMNQQASPNVSTIYYTNGTLAGNVVDILANPQTTYATPTYSMRSIGIFAGQLYGVMGNLTGTRPNGLYKAGVGIPTSANNLMTTVVASLFPFKNMEQFGFESMSPTGSGRVFIGDQATADAITRWDFNSGGFTETANLGSTTIFTYGVALGQDSLGTPVVFAGGGSANPNNKIRRVDRNGGTAYDVAQSDSRSGNFQIYRGIVVIPDATPPSVTTITLTGANPNTDGNPTFAVTFDQKVFNVQSTNFTKTGSLAGSGTIGTPTTSDNLTWNVPVTGLTGSGTLGLDKTTNNYVQDATGNILTGGNAVGPQFNINVAATAAQNWTSYN